MKSSAQRYFARLKRWWKDCGGSATTETVGSVAIVCVLILNCMLLLGYAIQVNQVSYAAKRLARAVEISGYTTPDRSEERRMLYELLPNAAELEAEIAGIDQTTYDTRRLEDGRTVNTIQLSTASRNYLTDGAVGDSNPAQFTIRISAYYKVTLATVNANMDAAGRTLGMDEDPNDAGIQLRIPIRVAVTGQSEIFWKEQP